jgi:hypothetical protein
MNKGIINKGVNYSHYLSSAAMHSDDVFMILQWFLKLHLNLKIKLEVFIRMVYSEGKIGSK